MHDFYRDSLGQLGATRGSGESGYDGEGGGGEFYENEVWWGGVRSVRVDEYMWNVLTIQKDEGDMKGCIARRIEGKGIWYCKSPRSIQDRGSG